MYWWSVKTSLSFIIAITLYKKHESNQTASLQGMNFHFSHFGISKPLNSPSVSPLVLIKKKKGSTHFCVDYYTQRRNDDTLGTLVFKSVYRQVKIHSDKLKAVFTVGTELVQYDGIASGLCNALANFELQNADWYIWEILSS